VTTLSKTDVAERAGVDEDFVDRVASVGLIKPDAAGRFVAADARRTQLAHSLEDESGIALSDLSDAVKDGLISFEFMDAGPYERWASVGSETFEEVSARTGVPLHLLMALRDATGGAMASPGDRMREDELSMVPLLEQSAIVGYRPASMERILRVLGENLRRLAETASELWRVDVIGGQLASGMTALEMGEWTGSETPARFSTQVDHALLAVYHAQEAHTWGANIIRVLESAIADAGIERRLDRPPAMCFLDITGYTRLTQERGDEAAAALAGDLARLVQRTSASFGGRPVKWLGDGVMLHFRDPGSGVRAALAMIDGVREAGLPPAHVGLHAGPVIFQDGDYFGQTVNIASRIAEYARPGEVVVSDEVVTASAGAGLDFREIGPVELKGVSTALRLYSVQPSGQ
jgi:adenylate cyclase